MKVCHACKKELSHKGKAGRRDACPQCSADLTCCLNCSLYDRSASRKCREPLAELVKDKERANFCDYFLFMEFRNEAGPADGSNQARKTLDSLFKK